MKMYEALSGRLGYSQVLFLGILSPHFYLVTLRLRYGVSATASCQRAFGAKIVALRLHRWHSDGTIDLVYKRHFSLSALEDGISQQLGCGAKHSTVPRRSHP